MIIIIDFEGVKCMKYSKQREALLTLLRSTRSHPSADWLYENLRKEFPNISLGTVYRNLTFLVDNGMAMKVPCSDGSVHFDGNVNPHYHFQCVNCGKVMDLNFDSREVEKNFNEAAAKNFDGTIQGNVTFFYGECSECIDK